MAGKARPVGQPEHQGAITRRTSESLKGGHPADLLQGLTITRPSSTPSVSTVLGMQRAAGNQAACNLISGGGVAVQRLSVRPSDLDAHLGLKSREMGKRGRSTFYSIRSTLANYLLATTVGDQAALLERLDGLCTKWIAKHGRSSSRGDSARAALVRRLADELAPARAELSKKQAQGIYLGNARDPATEHALKALRPSGKGAAKTPPGKEGQALVDAKGLTPAEVAAIRIFSAADYTYINPATANNPSWLKAQKDKKDLGLENIEDKTLMEEGSLHTAIAMQGLAKLDSYAGEAYRGARYTAEEFAEKFGVGKKLTFDSFASSAQDKKVALRFVHGLGIEYKIAPEKDIGVLSILSDTGGKDISSLSMVQAEKEVLLLPGSEFVIESLTEVDGATEYADLVKIAAAINQPLPKKWFVARLRPAPKKVARVRPFSK